DRDTAPSPRVPARDGDGPRAGRRVDSVETTTALPGRDRADRRPAARSRPPGQARSGTPVVGNETRTGRRHGAAERPEETGAERVARIDETLTRMTAAHAGLSLASDHTADDPAPARLRLSPVRLVCVLLAVAVLGTAGCGFATRAWLGSAVSTVSALEEGSGAIVDGAAQHGATNVLIVAGERETVPGTARHDAHTFAIAHVPTGDGPVTVLALPADLEINRPPCDRYDPITRGYSGPPVPAEARTQLVSALAVGGPRCVTRVVQQLTGVAVTDYLGIDLDGLARLADSVGGIGVCVTRPVVDAVLGPILPGPGTQRLDGARILDYLRATDVTGDPGGGAGQVERQQGVLAAALAPLLSTAGLLDVGLLAAARPALGRAIVVDGLDLDQVQATATSLRTLDADGIRFVAAPTTAGQGGGVALRDTEAAALFAALRAGKPLPAATAGPGTDGPQPGDVEVDVRNASDRTGLADEIGGTLRQLGFGVGKTANAAQRTSQTIIRYSPDQEATAELLARSVPAATTVPDPGSSGVLQLVLGRSFDDVVRPPAGPDPDPGAAAGSGHCS
ncbi:MAG: LCP family protein, partial [Pseudonocardia sp.]|nr:LCP family protein [Pseudonocardia sp.]